MNNFYKAVDFLSSTFLIANCTVLLLVLITIYAQRMLHGNSKPYQRLQIASFSSLILYLILTGFTMHAINNGTLSDLVLRVSYWFGAIMLMLTTGLLELFYPKLENLKRIKNICWGGSVAIVVLPLILPILIFTIPYFFFVGTCIWYFANRVRVSVNEQFNNIIMAMGFTFFLQLIYTSSSSLQLSNFVQFFFILFQFIFLLCIFYAVLKWSNRIVKNSVWALQQHQSTEHVAPKPIASINNMIPEEPSKVTPSEIQPVEKVPQLTKKEEPIIQKVSSSEHFSNLPVEEKRPEPPIKITEEPSSNNTDSASKPIIDATRSMDAFNTNRNLHIEKKEEKRPELPSKNTEESTLNHTEHPEPKLNDTANKSIVGETKLLDLFSETDSKPPIELKKNPFEDLD